MIHRTFGALLMAAGLALAPAAHAQTGPIKLGAVLSLTGPVGFIGDPQQKVLELQVKQLNEQGGILGRQVELVIYDDQSDPGNANTFAKRLIDSDKVDVLLGGTITPSAMAMVPHAERSAVPYVSFGGGASIVEPVKKWVFKTPPTDRLVAERILQDLKDHGHTHVALLAETSGFGQSGRKELTASAPKYGITIVTEETYGAKDTDVTPQLTKIRGTAGIQALIVFCGAGPSPAMAARGIAQLGLKLPVYMPHAAVNQELIKLAGAAAEGIRMPTAAFVVIDALAEDDPSKKIGREYYASYKSAYGTDASPFGSNAADALMIAIDALRRAGSIDKAKVRDAIEETDRLVGLNGTFTMSAEDHNGLDLDDLRMVEVREGRFVLAK